MPIMADRSRGIALALIAVVGCAPLREPAQAPSRLASADPCAGGPYEARGLRRAGMVMTLLGATAVPSGVALMAWTDGRQAPVGAVMIATAAVLMGAGIDMWVEAEGGRPTTPRDRGAMYLGMALAGIGFVALQASSSLVVAAFDEEIGTDALRIGAFASMGGADALIAVGIPMWAWGAAAPEDRCR
jgi:hypothetical protein